MIAGQRLLGKPPSFQITKADIRANEIAFLVAGLGILILALLIRVMLSRPGAQSPLFRLESENRSSSLWESELLRDALREYGSPRMAASDPHGQSFPAVKRLNPITLIETVSAYVIRDPQPRLETLSHELIVKGRPGTQNMWVEAISMAAKDPVSHAGLPQPNPQALEKISSALISLQNLANPSSTASPASKPLTLAAPSSSGLAYRAQPISDSLPPSAQTRYYGDDRRSREIHVTSGTVSLFFFAMLPGVAGGGCIPNNETADNCAPDSSPAGNRARGADPAPNRDAASKGAVSAPPRNNGVSGAAPPGPANAAEHVPVNNVTSAAPADSPANLASNSTPGAGPTGGAAPADSPVSLASNGTPGTSPTGSDAPTNLASNGTPNNLEGDAGPGGGSGNGSFSRVLASLQQGEHDLGSTEQAADTSHTLASAAGDKVNDTVAQDGEIKDNLNSLGNQYVTTTSDPNSGNDGNAAQFLTNQAIVRSRI